MNKKRIIPIIIIFTIIFTILGATFAYWSWTSDNSNKTNITFTIGADFSCGANGGGNIASSNLAPASCTNSTYAIKREITTTITNSGSDPVSLDMWLKINSIDQGLSNTPNFKWALTTDSTTCSSNVVNEGTFQGKTANSTVTILSGDTATTSTYYLYIWLDNAETSTTSMTQTFSVSLGGACTNEQITEEYVYTSNLYVSGDGPFNALGVNIGEPIPDAVEIPIYRDPDGASAAMSALTTYSGGGNYPFFLKHKLVGGTVTESYVGFVITSEMVSTATDYFLSSYCNNQWYLQEYNFSDYNECASAYVGPTAGTYTLRGDSLYYIDPNLGETCKPENVDSVTGDCATTSYFESNRAIMMNAFGSSSCELHSSENSTSCSIPYYFWVLSEKAGLVQAIVDEYDGCVVTYTGESHCIVVGG